MTELNELRTQYETCKTLDPSKQTRIKIEIAVNANKLLAEADEYLTAAQAASIDTTRLADLIGRADAFKEQILADTMGTGTTSRLQTVN